MGLTRVRAVAERLAVLQPAHRAVIIAGTNGKGSTAVALETILVEAGLTVGATLSPHVERFNERIRINAEPLADAALCDLFEQVETARLGHGVAGAIALTYFEFATLAALLAFRRAAVDVAILEVGLGGRLDAFNIVDAEVAIVTSIGLDHVDYLGDDLEQIGREKAGVFRRGQDVVLGEVTASVIDAAVQLDCRISRLGVEFAVEESAGHWSYLPAKEMPANEMPAKDRETHGIGRWVRDIPRGSLAPANCALAARAAAILLPESELSLQCLGGVRFEGRMETFCVDGTDVIADVAHNPAAANFLRAQLAIRYPHRQYVAIISALDGKDVQGVARSLAPMVSCWLTIDSTGPRGLRATSVARMLAQEDLAVEPATSISDALTRARSATEPGNGILVVGSFSAVEQARALLRPLSEHPESRDGHPIDRKNRSKESIERTNRKDQPVGQW